jgi:hypothetical protein
MGESALILRVQSTRKMSALNEKCTSGMLPLTNLCKMQSVKVFCNHRFDGFELTIM